jgi:hypothetical protein
LLASKKASTTGLSRLAARRLAVKYLGAKQKSWPAAAGAIGLRQLIQREKCVRKIDLDQIHRARVLID